jgi:hypothetical protein
MGAGMRLSRSDRQAQAGNAGMTEPAPSRLEVIRAVVARGREPPEVDGPEVVDWQELKQLFDWRGFLTMEEI